MWVNNTPGVLKEAQHLAIHTLRFEVSRVDIPEQRDGNEQVQKHEVDQDDVGTEECITQHIVPASHRLSCLSEVIVCRVFHTMVMRTITLSHYIHDIVVPFACGDHNQCEKRIQRIRKIESTVKRLLPFNICE